ncbi:MAG TPA: YbaY family lipoprotein [Opitutaceae bacterium]|nr:YbaY family lipoprotein [Opitutaceae bacterium]
MKIARLLLSLAALGALAGCGQMDFTPEGNPARVLSGEVSIADVSSLPADATVTIRVIDNNTLGMPPRVLGAQTINSPGAIPIPFRVEYQAEDDLLRLGLNIEVRVSYGGKVQYFNRNHYAVSLGNVSDTHRISVDRS